MGEGGVIEVFPPVRTAGSLNGASVVKTKVRLQSEPAMENAARFHRKAGKALVKRVAILRVSAERPAPKLRVVRRIP